MTQNLLLECPNVSKVVNFLDLTLRKYHPLFFGPNTSHPFLKIKHSKIMHDNLWGTNRFSWRELAIIDSPIFQRLRYIHQTGLAFQVYMAAHHTRFEHCIGVATIASRIFDALHNRCSNIFKDIANVIGISFSYEDYIAKLKQELRMAALLHDIGHSIHSHTSELVFGELNLIKLAANELSEFTGKTKGAAEVIAFCVTLTDSIKNLLDRAKDKLMDGVAHDVYYGDISLSNIALMILGRAEHPLLQFMGDIISSELDADKLDYLLRDASNAGLPLKYDLDRYLFKVSLEEGYLPDGEGKLNKLYHSLGTNCIRKPAGGDVRYPHFDTYRLRLPLKGMNVIEQIVICKLMLFSYIYHHQKVRASDGLLKKMLERSVSIWRSIGKTDEDILECFINMVDTELCGNSDICPEDDYIREYRYRLANRVLPREVFSITGAIASFGAKSEILRDYIFRLRDKEKRPQLINELEISIGKELLKLDHALVEPNKLKKSEEALAKEALMKAGVWVDVPTPPDFEDIHELVLRPRERRFGVMLKRIFPIGEWTEAYTVYRYPIRIFSFSEYYELTKTAAKKAMKEVIKISEDSFYEMALRIREPEVPCLSN